LSTDNARRDRALSTRHRTKSALLGSVCGLGLATALTLALGAAPAWARTKLRYQPAPKQLLRDTEHASKEPFGEIPKGPMQIIISVNQQKLHLYSDGIHIADSSVATGVPSLPTPFGVFSVIQKQVFHRSNIYSNAPMPYMQRITWSGVALHEGENIGHPASHGCIRMPHDFAVRLYGVTKVGARVIIARDELKPVDFADPHLFVRKIKPAAEIAVAPPAPESLGTAQIADNSKTTDAASAAATIPAKPAELGLRVSQDGFAGEHDAATGKPDEVATAVSKAEAPIAADLKAPTPTAPPQRAVPAAPSTAAPVVAKPDDPAPMPVSKPAELAHPAPINKSPIAIFVSRKEKKIYVRQNFEPLFDAAIAIDHPEQPLGTHVFTAMEFLNDNTTLRWTVVSLPGEPPKPALIADNGKRFDKHAPLRPESGKPTADLPPPQTPAEALARIEIPQDVIDNISQMMVPGSSLVVSDQGLGDETGGGTDFIVVTH
jgi:hypothetical protein